MLFSLNSKRTFDNEIKSTPPDVGPGVYNIVPVMGNHKKSKAPFGSRSERNIYEKPEFEAPPVGEYDPKIMGKSIAITSAFRSEEKRKVFTISKNPAPTDYQFTSTPKHIPNLNRCKRLPTQKITTCYVGQDITGFTDQEGKWVPMKIERHGPEYLGPGSYDPKPPADMAYSKFLGTNSKRDVFPRHDSFPGPGEYSPEKAKSEKLSVSIRNVIRDTPKKSDDPDEYLSPLTWTENQPETSAVFKSRNPRQTFATHDNTPGPTSYFRPQRLRMSAGDGFGTRAERNPLAALNDNPGPGAYDVQPKKWLKDRASIGRKTSVPQTVNDTPGPGQYRLTNSWTSGLPKKATSAFASRSTREETVGNDVPGPGRYTVKIDDKSHAVPTLIRETRFSKVGDWIDYSKEALPPPDAYQTVSMEPSRKKGRTISSLLRDPVNKDNFPGPGAYNVLHDSMLKRSRNAAAPQVSPE